MVLLVTKKNKMGIIVLANRNKKMKTTTTIDSSDWTCLPKNVVDEILDRLVALGDYVRFGAVCTTWRSTALEDRNYRGNLKKNTHNRFLDHQLPMLMLPQSNDDNIARFYSVTDRKVLQFKLPLPVPYSKRFIGSSLGWLISVDTDFVITLLNPFSGATISLQPIIDADLLNVEDPNFDFTRLGEDNFNPEYYFVKAVLSADPASHPDDFAVMVIFGESGMLAHIRPGEEDRGWVYYTQQRRYCDVIYSKSTGTFCALHRSGGVCLIDVDDPEGLTSFPPRLKPDPPPQLRYLVETCSGDLLQVLRYADEYGYRTAGFKVFKLNRSSPIPYWVELKSLGDEMLFLGDNSSLSVMASDFPGCNKPGSLYFTMPLRNPGELLVKAKPFQDEVPIDMGCLNIQSGLPFKYFGITYDQSGWAAIPYRPPIWVVPTFQEVQAAGRAAAN